MKKILLSALVLLSLSSMAFSATVMNYSAKVSQISINNATTITFYAQITGVFPTGTSCSYKTGGSYWITVQESVVGPTNFDKIYSGLLNAMVKGWGITFGCNTCVETAQVAILPFNFLNN